MTAGAGLGQVERVEALGEGVSRFAEGDPVLVAPGVSCGSSPISRRFSTAAIPPEPPWTRIVS